MGEKLTALRDAAQLGKYTGQTQLNVCIILQKEMHYVFRKYFLY